MEAQRRACKDYAAAQGLVIVGEYVDEAVSGKGSKTASRAQYQRMLRDCGKGLFDTILIHKFDRVARNLAEHVNLDKRLLDIGISLVAVSQDFGNTNEAKIIKALMWSLSEYYSDNLATEVKKGHRENALKALHNGGRPAFGYDVVDGKYVINELEAGYIRKIFGAALNREGFTKIIDEMNAAGLRGRLGKPFRYSSIYEIIRNEKYTGTYIYMPTKATKREDRRTKPGAIRIEDALPAIIDKAIFGEVQEIMDNHLQAGRRSKTNYLCSGLVYCTCGAKMHVHVSKKDEHTLLLPVFCPLRGSYGDGGGRRRGCSALPAGAAVRAFPGQNKRRPTSVSVQREEHGPDIQEGHKRQNCRQREGARGPHGQPVEGQLARRCRGGNRRAHGSIEGGNRGAAGG